MTSIPHVADAMRTVLEAVARTVARTSGAIKRERAMDGAQLVQTLVFGWLANPDATMHHLVAMAKTLGSPSRRRVSRNTSPMRWSTAWSRYCSRR